ncbi:ComF family protein [Streptomyces zinciresistens]|uniref:ComF family protein n=1 Tax=Streptomyces zinciresistens TaxID=1073330 RepID=UPI001FCAED83|nr:phosphoribosyltransferase family protein [Streptomyces zinciresistens]
MRRVEGLDPLGFPHCAGCPYYLGGSASICATCAARSLEPVPDAHCQVCSQALGTARRCSNALCELSPDERGFSRVDAIAMFSGDLENAVRRLKYDGAWGWAPIFGRLVVGWMERTPDRVADVDLIVGNPTWTGRTPIQHIETILKAAAVEDAAGRWPFPASPVLVKPVDTERSAGKNREAKRLAAVAHAKAIRIERRIQDRTLLLFDDLFTTGQQMQAVARLLRDAGAAEVRGLVLARAPWRGTDRQGALFDT